MIESKYRDEKNINNIQELTIYKILDKPNCLHDIMELGYVV